MPQPTRPTPWLLHSLAIPVFTIASLAAPIVCGAQTPSAPTRSAAQAHPTMAAQPPVAPVSERDLSITQQELIKLLRLSPTLTTVVSHDPSLLSDQEYVSRNNPQLAQFLAAHPEIARNPDYYLFTHLHHEDGSPDEALEREIWPELQPRYDGWSASDVIIPPATVLGFACFLSALVWLIRQILENRRWGRIFKLQSEVHSRLIERFGSNQELAIYMETEAGKRFLEASPIPVGFQPDQPVPNVIARVLLPLQIGVVLVLLGVGFFLLRNVRIQMHDPMLVLGTIALMPGIGFIISAGITWVLSSRLGLMPDRAHPSDRSGLRFDARNEK